MAERKGFAWERSKCVLMASSFYLGDLEEKEEMLGKEEDEKEIGKEKEMEEKESEEGEKEKKANENEGGEDAKKKGKKGSKFKNEVSNEKKDEKETSLPTREKSEVNVEKRKKEKGKSHREKAMPLSDQRTLLANLAYFKVSLIFETKPIFFNIFSLPCYPFAPSLTFFNSQSLHFPLISIPQRNSSTGSWRESSTPILAWMHPISLVS